MFKKNVFLLFLEKLTLKQNVKEFLMSMGDPVLKETLIFFADEYLKNPWNQLLEKQILSSAYGGEKFFNNVDFFILEKNYEMLEISLMILKLGFKGAKNDTNIYKEKIQSFLNLTLEKNNYEKAFQPSFFVKKPRLWKIILLCLIFFVSKQIFQIILIKFAMEKTKIIGKL